MITSYINVGEQLDVQLFIKTFSNLVLFEYGPVLTLHEIDKFCETLIKQITCLKPNRKEIFSQLLNMFSNSGRDDYVLKSTCILVRKTPYCIMIKFGSIDKITFILDLDISSLYVLGEGKTTSTPFQEMEYPVYRKMYDDLKEDFLRREQERIRSNFASFKESLKKDTKELIEKTELDLHNCGEYEKVISKTLSAANESQTRLKEIESESKEEIRKLNHQMLFIPDQNSKDKKRLTEETI